MVGVTGRGERQVRYPDGGWSREVEVGPTPPFDLRAGEGMSTRAIAPIVGADQKTISNDLRRRASEELSSLLSARSAAPVRNLTPATWQVAQMSHLRDLAAAGVPSGTPASDVRQVSRTPANDFASVRDLTLASSDTGASDLTSARNLALASASAARSPEGAPAQPLDTREPTPRTVEAEHSRGARSLGDLRRLVESCAGMPDESPAGAVLEAWLADAGTADGGSTYPFQASREALTSDDTDPATPLLSGGGAVARDFARMVFSAAARRWEEEHPVTGCAGTPGEATRG